MSRGVETAHPHAYPPIEAAGRFQQRPENKWPLFFAAMAANFGGLVMGTAIGWTGPELNLIVNEGNLSNSNDMHNNTIFPVTTEDGSLIASLYPVGALLGGLVGGKLIGKYGRKFAMFMITVLFAIGYLFLAAAMNKWMLFIGRLLCGFGTGITTISVPVYVSEAASADVRGLLGSLFQVMVTIGVLYVDIVGSFLGWRWISVACLGLVFIWSLLLLYIPESPVYFITQRDFEGARDSLQALRGNPYVGSELAEIQESVDRTIGRKANPRDLLRSPNLKPLLISLVLMMGQQFSGINAILFYSVTIFEAAKTALNSNVENIIIAGTQVVATSIAAGFMDKLGRRVLLMASSLGMIVSIYALGAYFWVNEHNPELAVKLSFLPVASLSVFILAFSIGFGPIPWVMMSEIFAPEVKTTASSISATFNWTLCFIVAQTFQPLTKAIGTASVFWIFGSIMVGIFIICLIFVPETKGRSLDQIQELFRRGSQREDEQVIIDNTVDQVADHVPDEVEQTLDHLEQEIQAESDIVRA